MSPLPSHFARLAAPAAAPPGAPPATAAQPAEALASRGPASRRRRRGFSITELLVVIGIIVLLIGILLPALNAAQQRSRATSTTSTMTGFAQACEAYHAQFGEYPGLVPERILANDPQISGTENAILALMGGAVRRDDFPADAAGTAAYNAFGGVELTFSVPGGGQFQIRYDARAIGTGPIVGGKPFAPFYSPSPTDFLPTPGQNLTDPSAENPFANDWPSDDDGALRIPDLLDGWGNPIVFMRAMRTSGPLVGSAGGTGPGSVYQFDRRTMNPYLVSRRLGERGADQAQSIINPGFAAGNVVDQIVAQAIRHPGFGQANAPLDGTARGAFVLISAGRDGIFFSREDGPGTRSDPITTGNLNTKIFNPGPRVFDEFNDIRLFGGG